MLKEETQYCSIYIPVIDSLSNVCNVPIMYAGSQISVW